MGNDSREIENLLQRLEFLLKRQESSLKEIYALKSELLKLKQGQQSADIHLIPADVEVEIPKTVESAKTNEEVQEKGIASEQEAKESRAFEEKLRGLVSSTKEKSDLERFIGENLISKIGIAITVIGVGIGAKYAIDHQLISPLTRILLGYMVGLGLFGFSVRLKKNYENFSAVLLSGAMAIFYFITFAAYSFYDLIPQPVTFLLMLLFTGFTVVASLKYNKQVIALYGMVGAYAIPFLLSNNSGQVLVLCAYIAIINAGILILSFKKYWRLLYYSSFALTWLIYASWIELKYDWESEFGIAFGFLSLFFVMFYATFLAYKMVQQEQFGIKDVILLLINSFVFYGFGYFIIEGQEVYDHLLGAFTLVNAIIHFVVAGILIKRKLADRNLIAFVIGLVLVFVTIAIPVQLDGNWVTLLWVFQAALLFWIGRTKVTPLYEKLSYPLMALACFSLLHDWGVGGFYYPYDVDSWGTVFFNIGFLTSILFIAAFGFINYIHRNENFKPVYIERKGLSTLIGFGLPLIFMLSIYFSFHIEIAAYFDQLYFDSGTEVTSGSDGYKYTEYNGDILRYQSIWLINFSIVYFCILLLINTQKIKNDLLGRLGVLFSVVTLFAFLTQGLFELSELREHYLNQTNDSFFITTASSLWLRYICFALVGFLCWCCWKQIQQPFIKMELRIPFEMLFHLSMVWILSSELIHWMDIAGASQTYKLGLSILWGVYSLGMIALGIWKNKKYLRIGAITLFGVTLVKLFLYDIASLDTIAKTIVFVSLGVLLLIISFLYNKFKASISNETKD